VSVQHEPMAVFHFCKTIDSMASEDNRTKEEAGLMNIINSMIQQLFSNLEPQFVRTWFPAHHVLSTKAASKNSVGSPSACSA
jgi:hypothetical protein